MFNFIFVQSERVYDIPCGSEIRHIIHKKIHEFVHQSNVSYFVLLADISHNERIENIFNVLVFQFNVGVEIRAFVSLLKFYYFQNIRLNRLAHYFYILFNLLYSLNALALNLCPYPFVIYFDLFLPFLQ